jgi:hypothetical protein
LGFWIPPKRMDPPPGRPLSMRSTRHNQNRIATLPSEFPGDQMIDNNEKWKDCGGYPIEGRSEASQCGRRL